MALGYAQGSIAGVDLQDAEGTPCKVLLLDAGNLKPTVIGSTTFAADGTAYTQILEVATGQQFGVKIEFIPPDVLNQIIDAINAALVGSGTFNVTLADDLNSINSDVTVNFAAQWVTIAPQRTHPEVVKDVEFRFLTIG
jgi:hypothetical protein